MLAGAVPCALRPAAGGERARGCGHLRHPRRLRRQRGGRGAPLRGHRYQRRWRHHARRVREGRAATVALAGAGNLACTCSKHSRDESAVTIRYVAFDNGVFIEQGVTATGTHGTQNTMVKLNATHGQIGDTYECQALSTTQWLLTINGRNGLIASGDIAIDPGNSGGYID